MPSGAGWIDSLGDYIVEECGVVFLKRLVEPTDDFGCFDRIHYNLLVRQVCLYVEAYRPVC